jgi:glyoxylase-like metal-dependent hydrolase (beta-lactamase superfamily II)
LVSHGDVLSCAGHHWQVIHVPGHSPGNTGLYAADERVLFSGDALFQGSIGRTDFPGGSLQVLTRAIRDRIYTLPGETRVLPGHGPSTTVGAEKATNPYVRS